MADYPIPELGNKTPLQAAYKPNMDSIAAKGRSGLIKNCSRRINSRLRCSNMLSVRLRPKSILYRQRTLGSAFKRHKTWQKTTQPTDAT